MACRSGGALRCLLLLAYCSSILGELLDLSHTFDNLTHYWDRREIFDLSEVFVGLNEKGYWYENYRFNANEHGGTHLDAPVHFFKGSWSTDEIPVDHLIANAAVVDMTEKSSRDPDAVLTPDDLTTWHSAHGPFQYPTIVLVNTGYAAFWSNRSHYFGERPDQPGVKHFPGIGEAAAGVLSQDPAVVGVGIDTASVDPGVSQLFKTHVTLGRANRFGLENVGDMSRVPATGARIFALPMKIAGGSGGPCRVVVELPDPATSSVASAGRHQGNGRQDHGPDRHRGHGHRANVRGGRGRRQ